jgi:hypothetical protein
LKTLKQIAGFYIQKGGRCHLKKKKFSSSSPFLSKEFSTCAALFLCSLIPLRYLSLFTLSFHFSFHCEKKACKKFVFRTFFMYVIITENSKSYIFNELACNISLPVDLGAKSASGFRCKIRQWI